MEQRMSHILDLRLGTLFQKNARHSIVKTVFKNKKKVGYTLTVPTDFVKPMCIVLVF